MTANAAPVLPGADPKGRGEALQGLSLGVEGFKAQGRIGWNLDQE